MFQVIQRYNQFLVYDSKSYVVHSVWDSLPKANFTAELLNRECK